MFAQSVDFAETHLESLKDLSSPYDALQILFDSNQKVIAFGWIGEGIGTPNITGKSLERSGIQYLSPEILSALLERCKR